MKMMIWFFSLLPKTKESSEQIESLPHYKEKWYRKVITKPAPVKQSDSKGKEEIIWVATKNEHVTQKEKPAKARLKLLELSLATTVYSISCFQGILLHGAQVVNDSMMSPVKCGGVA